MNNGCSKCGLYYNAIIEGSILVNQCKCLRYILKKDERASLKREINALKVNPL